MTFLLTREKSLPFASAARILPTGKILRASEYALLLQAGELLDSARVQADIIMNSAQEAYNAECERGYVEGRLAASPDLAARMVSLTEETRIYLGGIEGQMVDVVIGALRQVIGDFDDRERVVRIVRTALALVRQQKHVTVRLHPESAEIVRQAQEDLLAQFPGIDYLDIVCDDRLIAGTCRLETEIGTIEASIEEQVAILREAFQRALGERKGIQDDAGAPV
jgi:type III secretion protein L